MNNVRAIQKINEAELQSGTKKSWHDMYSHSAYIFIGGLNYDLTEGDVLAVFSQYGEIININLVKDKKTGKSKGFCFLCYEDQRSTTLAVDNFNGIKLCGRTIRVDHVNQYRRPKDESGNEIIEKGCAPKTPTPSPTPSPERSPEPVEKKPKEIKKPSKDKKKKKKIKKKYRDSDSDEHSSQDGDMVITRLSSKRSTVGGAEWSRGDDSRESLHAKERKGKMHTRDYSSGHRLSLSPSPPPKHKSKASTSERSRWYSRGESGPSTTGPRQSYKDSRSRSRSTSRSRDRGRNNRRKYCSSEDAKSRSRSRSRDRSEHRENSKTHFDRSGKTKHAHR